MFEMDLTKETYVPQMERLVALVIYSLILLFVGKLVTGEWISDSGGKRLWLISGISLWFLSLISAPFFRSPKDSLVHATTVAVALSILDLQSVSSFAAELDIFRWFSVGLAIITALAAAFAMKFHNADPVSHPRFSYFSKITYRISDAFGRGEVIFTPPALISIVGFYQTTPLQQLWLLFVWTFLVSVKPVDLVLRLIGQLRSIAKSSRIADLVGKIRRIDNPNIVRVALDSSASWKHGEVTVACLPNSNQVQVLPLFTHLQDAELVGTGLFHGAPDDPIANAISGHVYRPTEAIDACKIIDELSGIEGGAELIGFVVEDSTISNIRFEVSQQFPLEEGMLIFCRQAGQLVYYQILDARTAEESFEQNPRGKHLVMAAQLGCLNEKKGFTKYGWLPLMNAPVFLPRMPVEIAPVAPDPDELEIGKIPGSEIGVQASFADLLEYHAAILGVTGTGKTELVLDIIRHAISTDAKVFCVDFTGEYKARLCDLDPQPLGLNAEDVAQLDARLFDVETGSYRAGPEKAALKDFVDEISPEIRDRVDQFLSAERPDLGIFELPEITNTKATLRATELYLSSIMNWARNHRKARRVLIVLEEAHTIIPETTGAGFDYDTQWVVGRISQIALQGRKYGVGLLIVSQRTALVSKSILSQCNTHITFSLVDKTSIDYLSNVYSGEYVQRVPNLRFLEALAFGKAIRSERPVLIKLQYDPAKKMASEALNVILTDQAGNKERGSSQAVPVSG